MSCVNCTVGTPLRPPQLDCNTITPRKGICIKRFGYISCKASLDVFALVGQDQAAVYTALNTIIGEGNMGWTGLLAAGEWADPQSQVESNAECLAAIETVATRDLTFSDYNGYDTDESGNASVYFEYDMYDLLNNNAANYFLWVIDCNNDFWLFYKSVSGVISAIPGSIYAYKTSEKTQVGNTTVCKQVIKAKVSFIGDAIGFKVKPLVNVTEATGALAELL